MDKTKSVDRPHPPVSKSSPDHFRGKTFTIMHIGLGRVIAQNSIDNNRFLPEWQSVVNRGFRRNHSVPFIKPPIRAEPAFCFAGTWRHEEPRCNTNKESKETLQKEEVSPPLVPGKTPHLEDPCGHESAYNVGNIV